MINSDRIHRLGGFAIRITLAGGLGMFLMLELLGGLGGRRWLLAIPAVLAIVTVLFAESFIPRGVIAVAVLSIAGTVMETIVPSVGTRVPGIAEAGALLVLLPWTIRRWDAEYGRIATVLLAVAVAIFPARLSEGRELVVAGTMMLTTAAAMVGLGLYLRSVDVRRRNALTEVRRGERLELARDLHDFVAHHVTGMVVQAQAAQFIPAADPARYKESFAAIEQAGLEALTSMRRLVAVLREADAGGGTGPLADLAQVTKLVEQFSVGDTYASLYVSPELTPGEWPPEIAATVYRVVQEALTNVRKHAPSAATVSVSVAMADGDLEVSVRDNGRRAGRTVLGRSGGGFGLAGLTERLDALGGRLHAGPRPEGGWELVARLPLAGSVPQRPREPQ